MKQIILTFFCFAMLVGAVDITGCTNITTAGTYNLTQDITYATVAGDVTSNDCININTSGYVPVGPSDYVYLDCQNHTITVNMTQQQQNTPPINGYAPIHINNAPGTQVVHCTIRLIGGNTTAVGVYVENTNSELLPGGLVTNTIYGGGIECQGVSKFNIANVTVYGGNIHIRDSGLPNPSWAATIIGNNHVYARTDGTASKTGQIEIGPSAGLGGYLVTSDYVITGNVLDGSWSGSGQLFASGMEDGIAIIGPTQRFEIMNNSTVNNWDAGIELVNSHSYINIHDNTFSRFGLVCLLIDWNISFNTATFANNTCDNSNLNASLFLPNYPMFVQSTADTFLPITSILWKNVTFTGNTYKSAYRGVNPSDVFIDLVNNKFSGSINIQGTNSWTNNTFISTDGKPHYARIVPSNLVTDGGGNKCNWYWDSTTFNPPPYPITCIQ